LIRGSRTALVAVLLLAACDRSRPPPDLSPEEARTLQRLKEELAQQQPPEEDPNANLVKAALTPPAETRQTHPIPKQPRASLGGVTLEVVALTSSHMVEGAKMSIATEDRFLRVQLAVKNAGKRAAAVDLGRAALVGEGERTWGLARDVQRLAGTRELAAELAGGESRDFVLFFEVPDDAFGGGDALRAALPNLERDLRDGGFATLNLNVRDAPQADPRPAWATSTTSTTPAPAAPGTAAVTPTATDFATGGNATTTTGAKTEGQPIGQVLQPDGSGPIRRDDGTGQYNAAGAVAATHHSPGAQSSGAGAGNGGGQQQQLSAQLNLGQPGGQPGQQPDQPGNAFGRHPGAAPENGTGPQPGLPAPGEPDPPVTGNRPADRTGVRSVDLRV
jgi:hypothetical protein